MKTKDKKFTTTKSCNISYYNYIGGGYTLKKYFKQLSTLKTYFAKLKILHNYIRNIVVLLSYCIVTYGG